MLWDMGRGKLFSIKSLASSIVGACERLRLCDDSLILLGYMP